MLETRLGVGESQYTKIRSLKACPKPQGVTKECDGMEVGISLQINLIIIQDTDIQFKKKKSKRTYAIIFIR